MSPEMVWNIETISLLFKALIVVGVNCSPTDALSVISSTYRRQRPEQINHFIELVELKGQQQSFLSFSSFINGTKMYIIFQGGGRG